MNPKMLILLVMIAGMIVVSLVWIATQSDIIRAKIAKLPTRDGVFVSRVRYATLEEVARLARVYVSAAQDDKVTPQAYIRTADALSSALERLDGAGEKTNE